MPGKKEVKHIAEETGHAALLLLRLLASSGEAFPPVKAIASVTIDIAEMILSFRSSQRQWSEFSLYVQTMVSTVIQFIPNASETRDDLKRNLQNLERALYNLCTRISAMRKRSTLARFWSHTKEPDVISEMRRDLDNALSVFHLRASITTGMDAAKTQEMAEQINKYVQLINDKLSDKIVSNMALSTLPYAEGASWNPTRVCLPETRTAIQETIWQWINSTGDKKRAEIFCIADVAGAGKSALAHSVAKHCYDNNILGSCFFFDRETADRHTPRKFITTLARDLSLLDKDVAEHIVSVIDDEPGIVMSQSISHQFRKLIQEPFSQYPMGRPVVVVIDALDEGYDSELLTILCDEIPNLPPCFRIFLTTRPEEDIATLLFQQSHVHHQALDIHNEQNLSDIAIYTRSRLKEVAIRKRMGSHWPSRDVVDKFTSMAEGLFIWVSTICDYLLHSTSPDKKLNALIKDRNFSDMGAVEKMNKLYLTILNTCNWDDKDFVDGYRLVMGAIIALKTPLSINALQSLHRNTDLRVSEVTYSLAPLLTGSTQEEQPIRLPHLSLRDFITRYSLTFGDCQKFSINEKEHSRRLAQLCLAVLVQDLKPGLPGTDYLRINDFDDMNIPEVPAKAISEVLYYSCRFWMDHVPDVKEPIDVELLRQLEMVLSTRIILWAELCTAYGRFQSFKKLRDWMLAELPRDSELHKMFYRPELAQKLTQLSYCLSFHGRRKEALECADEATEIGKIIVNHDPSPDNEAVLATSLNAFACRLADMGDREQALNTAQAAVSLREKIVEEKDIGVDADLGMFLTTLARSLSSMGKPEDGLNTINRAVELQRDLMPSDPKRFKPLLAASLNTLSARLSEVGQKRNALQAARETVQLRRELAMENPKRYNGELAVSLNTLSARLSQVGQQKEAVEIAQESVKLNRESAIDRPATYRVHLAGSLNTLSARLAAVNRHEEALKVAEEGAEMARQLAKENPSAFKTNFAMTLNTLSARLAVVGRLEEAVETGKQSVQLRRELQNERPKAHDGTRLAFALSYLARRYLALDRLEDALQVIEESIGILRPLAADHPSAFNVRLAEGLELAAKIYGKLDRSEEKTASVMDAKRLRSKADYLSKESDM